MLVIFAGPLPLPPSFGRVRKQRKKLLSHPLQFSGFLEKLNAFFTALEHIDPILALLLVTRHAAEGVHTLRRQ